MKLSAFFPQDTRTTEFASAFALVSLSLMCFHAVFYESSLNISALIAHHQIPFWVLITAVLGGLQMLAVVLYPKTEVLRVILAWVNGSFWIWLSLTISPIRLDPSDIGTFFLGMTNLYAFCINALLLRKTWES